MRISPAIWRHKLAALAVLGLALCVAFGLTRVTAYTGSATVVFRVTRSLLDGPRQDYRDSLIATEVMMSQDLASQSVRSQVVTAGGSTRYTLAPFNLYDLEYPNFSVPMATLTATAATPAAAQRTLGIVRAYLVRRLAALQARAHVAERHRLVVYVADDGSVVRARGSRARVFGALAVVTVIVLSLTMCLLDKNDAPQLPVRPARRRYRPAHVPDSG